MTDTTKIETKAVKTTPSVILTKTSKTFTKGFLILEERIRKANKAFLITGMSLCEINNKSLYNQRGFHSFELYVVEIFDFTRDYAYKIMSAYRVFSILNATGFKSLPANEGQCRPMTQLDDSKIISAWDTITTQTKGRITAKVVTQVVNELLGKSTPEPKKNSTPAEPKEESGPVKVDPAKLPGDAPKEPGDDIPVTSIDSTGITEKVTAPPKLDAEKQLDFARAKIAQLEEDLKQARAKKSSAPKSKLALAVYRAGIKAMMSTADEETQEELLTLKDSLLG